MDWLSCECDGQKIYGRTTVELMRRLETAKQGQAISGPQPAWLSPRSANADADEFSVGLDRCFGPARTPAAAVGRARPQCRQAPVVESQATIGCRCIGFGLLKSQTGNFFRLSKHVLLGAAEVPLEFQGRRVGDAKLSGAGRTKGST